MSEDHDGLELLILDYLYESGIDKMTHDVVANYDLIMTDMYFDGECLIIILTDLDDRKNVFKYTFEDDELEVLITYLNNPNLYKDQLKYNI